MKWKLGKAAKVGNVTFISPQLVFGDDVCKVCACRCVHADGQGSWWCNCGLSISFDNPVPVSRPVFSYNV